MNFFSDSPFPFDVSTFVLQTAACPAAGRSRRIPGCQQKRLRLPRLRAETPHGLQPGERGWGGQGGDRGRREASGILRDEGSHQGSPLTPCISHHGLYGLTAVLLQHRFRVGRSKGAPLTLGLMRMPCTSLLWSPKITSAASCLGPRLWSEHPDCATLSLPAAHRAVPQPGGVAGGDGVRVPRLAVWPSSSSPSQQGGRGLKGELPPCLVL